MQALASWFMVHLHLNPEEVGSLVCGELAEEKPHNVENNMVAYVLHLTRHDDTTPRVVHVKTKALLRPRDDDDDDSRSGTRALLPPNLDPRVIESLLTLPWVAWFVATKQKHTTKTTPIRPTRLYHGPLDDELRRPCGGQGTMWWSAGTNKNETLCKWYQGAWANGQRHGRGKCTWHAPQNWNAVRRTYDGSWHQDKPSGHGELVVYDFAGTVAQEWHGTFVDGKPHGQLRYRVAASHMPLANTVWVHGKLKCYLDGEFTLSNGDAYKGEYMLRQEATPRGRQWVQVSHGRGEILRNSSGARITAEWRNGVRVLDAPASVLDARTKEEFHGYFDAKGRIMRDGSRVLQHHKASDIYLGEMVGTQGCGSGTLVSHDGLTTLSSLEFTNWEVTNGAIGVLRDWTRHLIYHGQCHNNNPHGFGTMYYVDRDRAEFGRWEHSWLVERLEPGAEAKATPQVHFGPFASMQFARGGGGDEKQQQELQHHHHRPLSDTWRLDLDTLRAPLATTTTPLEQLQELRAMTHMLPAVRTADSVALRAQADASLALLVGEVEGGLERHSVAALALTAYLAACRALPTRIPFDDLNGQVTPLGTLLVASHPTRTFSESLELATPAVQPAMDLRALRRNCLRFARKLRLERSDMCQGLTDDEIAAIHCYTQESPFYRSLNQLLRDVHQTSSTRHEPEEECTQYQALLESLTRFGPFLRLLQSALQQLTPVRVPLMYRAVDARMLLDPYLNCNDADDADQWNVWVAWGFTSATLSRAVLDEFVRNSNGPRTIFTFRDCRAFEVPPLPCPALS